MDTSSFLQAFEGTNERVPVWFMRQAGRYLPQYQAIKSKHSLEEMFKTPELAAEITCMPVDILNVDAAILFADILTLPAQMGFDIHFDSLKGPIINHNFDIQRIHDFDNLDYICRIIELVSARLSKHIPLIGFAGSPFTVLTYLIEGGSSVNFSKTYHFMYNQTEIFTRLMDILTKNTIQYLNLQKKSGIKAFQLFDTWAGILRATDYAHYVLPFVKKIFEQVDIPSIYYVKNCGHLLSLMDQTEAQFLSVCHTVLLGHSSIVQKTKKGIQGNLFNGLLLGEDDTIIKETNDVLVGARRCQKFIFNLSHGILPNTDVNKVKLVVDQVHSFPWKK